jgi:hypothetical protein
MEKPALPFTEEGRKFIKLLMQAAGVDGQRVQSIECRVSVKELITFKVELMASEDNVKAAVNSLADITKLGDAFVTMANAGEPVPCP